jgi:hypothetical protein
MEIQRTYSEGVATVWEDDFKIDCPKCKRTIFQNHAVDRPQSSIPCYECPNCSGNVQLVERYWLTTPNQGAWPGHEEGQIWATTLCCSAGCGWSADMNDKENWITHQECGAKIGANGIQGLTEFELHGKSLLSKFFSFFK